MVIFLRDYWEYVTGVVVFISGIVLLLKNIEHFKYLKRQNKAMEPIKADIQPNETEDIVKYENTELIVNKISNDNTSYLADLHIEVSDIAENAMRSLSISKLQLLELIGSEFKSHPILSRVDYEFSPRPLKNGLFVILSKLDNELIVENISKILLSHNLYDLHNNLCNAYFDAYQLPFRTNHFALMKKSTFKHTIKILERLIKALSEFCMSTKIYHDENFFPHFHRLKSNAHNNLVSAEINYYYYVNTNDVNKLNEVALRLDGVISAIHKAIIKYPLPK